MALTVTHAETGVGPSNKVTAADWEAGHVIAGDYLRKSTVTLSSADILALHTTPVTLVAAPGAGKVIAVHKVVAFYAFGTTAYVYTGDPESLLLGGSSIGEVGEMLAETDSTFAWVTPTINPVGTSGVVNQPVVATVGSAITDGGGTLTITTWYSIEDVP